MPLTYVIVPKSPDRPYLSILCLICHMTSYNINDVINRYCGNCHIFHEDGVYREPRLGRETG